MRLQRIRGAEQLANTITNGDKGRRVTGDIHARPLLRLARSAPSLATAALVLLAGAKPTLAQKTDTVEIIRGSHVIGEVHGLLSGTLQLGTWAMSTVYIEWPKVSTVTTTNKVFEIDLSDGRRFFGSLRAAQAPNEITIITGADTLTVPTQSVVALFREKRAFWARLDGSIDLGADYTQQNNKVDLNLAVTVRYKHKLNNFRLTTNTTFSRQEGVDNITSSNSQLAYAREVKNRWFYGGFLSAERNSQLDLELRGTLGGGPGRFLVQTNRVTFGLWGGIAYAEERYTGQASDGTVPAFLTGDFLYFLFGALDKQLSSQLTVMPVLGSNRVRVQFNSNLKWELVHELYLNFGIIEAYDSNPPAEGANKNDLSVTTSLGFSF